MRTSTVADLRMGECATYLWPNFDLSNVKLLRPKGAANTFAIARPLTLFKVPSSTPDTLRLWKEGTFRALSHISQDDMVN